MPLMHHTFEQDGVRFQYPANWTLEREANDAGWTVTVQSPDTSFVLVTFDADQPTPEDMNLTALEAMQAEYTGLESEEALESIAGQPATGHDMTFFSFDLSNTCRTRSFYASGGTVLLFWQASDLELATAEPAFRALCASVRVVDED